MKNQISMISVPSTTLNALKGLLFSEKGEVDLSPIVSDLTTADTNPDLMAINVGLTFRGLKPEIDTTRRYSKDYRSLVQYDFISYSLILDKVTAHRKVISKWDDNKGDLCPYKDDGYDVSFSLSEWYGKDTESFPATNEIVKQFKKRGQTSTITLN